MRCSLLFILSCTSAALDGGIVFGADRLLTDPAFASWLRNRTVGVISNPTGTLSSLTHVVDALLPLANASANASSPGVVGGPFELRCVFGPEHGFRGDAQAGQGGSSYVDGRTGLPVYAAYAQTVPQLAALVAASGVDMLVFDIQDIGTRFYTYVWALFDLMRAGAAAALASAAGTPLASLRFVVLDRPNPLGGARAAGPMLRAEYQSGVGGAPIPLQHGMTVGELARLFNGHFLPQPAYGGAALADLRVVPALGWARGDATGHCGRRGAAPAVPPPQPAAAVVSLGIGAHPWIPPSPNMPSCATATVYPGLGLFEATNVSEGRGTTHPFETVGAPWIDWRLAAAMRNGTGGNSIGGGAIPGAVVRETYFTPTFSKFQGMVCGGVFLHVVDAAMFDPLFAALTLISAIARLYPASFAWRAPDSEGRYWVDLLSGSNFTRLSLDRGEGAAEIVEAWEADDQLVAFRALRKQYLIPSYAHDQ